MQVQRRMKCSEAATESCQKYGNIYPRFNVFYFEGMRSHALRGKSSRKERRGREHGKNEKHMDRQMVQL